MTYQPNYYRNAFAAVVCTLFTGIVLMASVVGPAANALA